MTITQSSAPPDDSEDTPPPNDGASGSGEETLIGDLGSASGQPWSKSAWNWLKGNEKVSRSSSAFTIAGGLSITVGATLTVLRAFHAKNSGEMLLAVLLGISVFVCIVLCIAVNRKGVGSVTAGNFARLAVFLLTVSYGGMTLIMVVSNVSPNDAWLRSLGAIWLVLSVSTFALASRSAEHEADKNRRAYTLSQTVLFFLLGSAIFGAGTAVIALGARDMSGTLMFRGLPLISEGVLVGVLGLALLLSRRAWAAILMIGVGIAVGSFGGASIMNGQVDFGCSTIAVGASGIVLGAALLRQSPGLGKVGFGLGGLGSLLVAWSAFNTQTIAFAITMFAVGVVMTVILAILLTLPIARWQFEKADNHEPWKRSTTITVGVVSIVAGAVVAGVTVWAIQEGDVASFTQVAGLASALVAVGVLVIVLRRMLSPLSNHAEH